MEETESTAGPSPHSLSSVSVEGRFTDLCKNKLALDEETQRQAMKLFQETKQLLLTTKSSIGSGTPEQVEQLWFAFVLFSVKRLSQGNTVRVQKESDGNAYTLCQLLRAAKLNMVDFFQELPQFAVRTAPVLSTIYGKDCENKLEAKELQANFVHLSILSKHYRRACREFFSSSDASSSKYSNGVNLNGYLSNCQQFGWLLFLALREHTANRFKDLVTCIIGLVSILAILIIHIPVHFRNFSMLDSSRFVKKEDKAVDLIASLCKMYDASEDELKKSLEKANKLIENILNKSPQAASQCKSENLEDLDRDGLIYYEDLLESSSLCSSINILENYYENAVHNSAELDERVFISEDHSLLGSEGLLADAMNISGIKKKLDSIASPARTITSPLSPYRSPAPYTNHTAVSNLHMAATPVSTAMTTAKWLRTVISPLPSKPSPGLEKFLTSCDRDITSDVICRAQTILDAIFPSSAPEERCISGSLLNADLVDNIWAQQRRMEALKLYYRVLEATCRIEFKNNDGSNLTSLLMNERFNRCMLACSAELVLATHKTVSTLFPVVLERTGITAFDICRVIEIFIRNEEYLPRELKRHLNSLEERLLESMVWQKGSTLYNYLTVAKPGLSAEIDQLGLLAEPMPSLDASAMQASLSCGGLPPVLCSQKNEGQNGDIRSPKRLRSSFTSPPKDRLLALGNVKSKPSPLKLQSTFASPAKSYPGGGGDTCADYGIRLIFSKIMKLAALRIAGMVERLHLLQQIKERVYYLFQKILNQQTSIFFRRHADQIILCCFYGVAKINQMNLTFKEIINNYKKLPHCKPQVYHSVFVDWSLSRRSGKTGQECVDIITFYNDFFIPSVKPLLQELVILGSPSNKNSNDVPFPESPKVSHFPSLPDISPKKVSPAQNVYVSPLRSSKRDVLVSPTSKSYYACLGESTSAFRSPSKDLTAINNCLNRPSKSRTALKLDADVGLAINDSTVASSLNIHDESRTRSSDVPSEQPSKRKQPES